LSEWGLEVALPAHAEGMQFHVPNPMQSAQKDPVFSLKGRQEHKVNFKQENCRITFPSSR
jgi:hypothetical protein